MNQRHDVIDVHQETRAMDVANEVGLGFAQVTRICQYPFIMRAFAGCMFRGHVKSWVNARN